MHSLKAVAHIYSLLSFDATSSVVSPTKMSEWQKFQLFYLDNSCCIILANNAPINIRRSWLWLCSISSSSSSLLSCGRAADVPTFLPVFPPQLLNHDCCWAAPEKTHTFKLHTHTQHEGYAWCHGTFIFQKREFISEQTSGERDSGEFKSVQSHPSYKRLIFLLKIEQC